MWGERTDGTDMLGHETQQKYRRDVVVTPNRQWTAPAGAGVNIIGYSSRVVGCGETKRKEKSMIKKDKTHQIHNHGRCSPFCNVAVRVDLVIYREGCFAFERQVSNDAKFPRFAGFIYRAKGKDDHLASRFFF